MIKKTLLITLLLILTACATEQGTSPTQKPVEPEDPRSAITTKVTQQLALSLGLDVSQVSLVSIEEMDWPDACLGLAEEGQMCAQVITPGYKVTLQAQGKEFIYRTNKDGSMIISEPSENVVIDPELPQAVTLARQFLAELLSVKPALVKVTGYSQRDWPNGCLGIAEKDTNCIDVITPGYLVTFELDGKAYKVRTNLSGSVMKLDNMLPLPGTEDS